MKHCCFARKGLRSNPSWTVHKVVCGGRSELLSTERIKSTLSVAEMIFYLLPNKQVLNRGQIDNNLNF